MNVVKSLTPLISILVIVVVLLAGISAAMQAGRAGWIVPAPDTAADGFIEALAAHRYEGALEALSQEQQQDLDWKELQSMVQKIEDSHLRGIEESQTIGFEEQGSTAVAELEVKFKNLDEERLLIPLIREQGEWKVDSIEPLLAISVNP
jgi:hypothetical protein